MCIILIDWLHVTIWLKRRFCERMEDLHFRVDDTPENTWAELRGSMTEAASEVFGLCRRKQPDWFLANSATLLPALADKRAARLSVLQDRNDSTTAHYRKARNNMK